jgi:nucleoside-diphosphate-sugar epimerase
MRIAITGSNGFIGYGLCRAAGLAGHSVLGISRSSTGPADFTGKYLQADVATADLAGAFSDFEPDVVIHAAGCASVAASLEKPLEDFKGSVIPWANVLEGVRKSSCRPQVFFTSSAAVYGTSSGEPLREDLNPQPLSAYRFHKQLCETLAREYSQCYGLSVSALRLFSVFGPRQRRLLVWDIFQKIRMLPELRFDGTGEETRDYLSISDISLSILGLCENVPADGEFRAINLASGHSLKIREMCETVARLLTCEKPIFFSGKSRPGDPSKWIADIGTLRGLLPDWKPEPFESSLHECLKKWQTL